MPATLDDVVKQLKENKAETEGLNNAFSEWFLSQERNRLDELEAKKKSDNRLNPTNSTVSPSNRSSGSNRFAGLLSGFGLAGAGIGLGAAGDGIGAFFLGLAGAEAIMNKFGSGDNLKTLLTNVAEGLSAFSTRDLTALGGLLGAGALFGAVPGLSGAKAGIGIASIGLGVAAFFSAFALGDMAISEMQANGSSIKEVALNFSEILSSFNNENLLAVGTLFAGSAAFGALFGTRAIAKGAFGLASIGLGIGGFFAGFAAGDMAIGLMQANGEAIKPIIETFMGLLTTLSSNGLLEEFGVLLGTSAMIGMFGGGGAAVVGLAAVGLGIGGFFAGIAAGDAGIQLLSRMTGGAPGEGFKSMLVNVSEGLKSFTGLEFDPSLGSALTGISDALMAFFGSQLLQQGAGFLEVARDAFLGVVDFFFGTNYGDNAGKGPIDLLIESLEPIRNLDDILLEKMALLPTRLQEITNAFQGLGSVDMTNFARSMENTISGLSFASDALLGLQTGLGQNGEDYIDTRNYFGGGLLASDRKIYFPEGGIGNAIGNVDIDKLREDIGRVYRGLGIDAISAVPSQTGNDVGNMSSRLDSRGATPIIVDVTSRGDSINNVTNSSLNVVESATDDSVIGGSRGGAGR